MGALLGAGAIVLGNSKTRKSLKKSLFEFVETGDEKLDKAERVVSSELKEKSENARKLFEKTKKHGKKRLKKSLSKVQKQLEK
ncbi:hypothetical protein A2382_04695 [Candidatus Woesebacteria bacterium RIFOXYB1_FULL_38_16]|uniref:Uncharacterized protein n=1 Tax=Candidatus Woesebacteria bacterium RIFOXYB1_FULL_38_16 TaxID=1802538 RepID=A0A1F8CUF7_9BACT|nr:MAG: hypothetical protein A2382_04695 [Candidatus Woesebacteria bacterium RIFOXYB1_FULL_38_16]